MSRKSTARSRQPTIGGRPACGSSSAPRSMAGHGEVQLGTLRIDRSAPGESDETAPCPSVRCALSPRSLPHGNARDQDVGRRSGLSASAATTCRAALAADFVTRRRIVGESAGIVVEQERQPGRNLVETIDRHRRNRHHRAPESRAPLRRSVSGTPAAAKYGIDSSAMRARLCQLQVVPVRPGQLLFVEDTGAQPHLVQRETARELVQRQQFGLVSPARDSDDADRSLGSRGPGPIDVHPTRRREMDLTVPYASTRSSCLTGWRLLSCWPCPAGSSWASRGTAVGLDRRLGRSWAARVAGGLDDRVDGDHLLRARSVIAGASVTRRVRIAILWLGLLAACIPLAAVVTIFLLPFWSWVESRFAVEAVGRSGPADWCYLVVYVGWVGLLGWILYQGGRAARVRASTSPCA